MWTRAEEERIEVDQLVFQEAGRVIHLRRKIINMNDISGKGMV